MKNQCFNPYLPSYEYIPDGEPHVFGDRVYVYGSHDRFNAPMFCMNDYVCYSAPIDDLSDWKYEGIIYKKTDDPKNRLGIRLLFAPDVCQGVDGRYYLYYAFDFMGIIGVAVSDSPAGKYEFYGYVHYEDGTIWGRKKNDQFPFDPAVLVDNGKVWLYSGFYTSTPAIVTGGKKLKNDGGTVVELSNDMLTIITEPKVIFPKEGAGSFKNHEFFEASSIRKDGETYVFVYSSRHNHELCYATSKKPDGGFKFGGTLVSLGDLFLDGNEDESSAKNYLGNTHGGMLNIGEDWYIFYHRQTNQHSYSRQACAEKLVRTAEGVFEQAEVTSCGLNGKPLKGKGKYEARIACNLWSKEGVGRYDGRGVRRKLKNHPFFTQTGGDRESEGDQYIANIKDGAVVGFKYFDFEHLNSIAMEVKGDSGIIEISTDENFTSLLGKVDISARDSYTEFVAQVSDLSGVYPLYFKYKGQGIIDFKSFTIR